MGWACLSSCLSVIMFIVCGLFRDLCLVGFIVCLIVRVGGVES